MLQFLGLAFGKDKADVAFVGRDGKVTHRRSTPIANVQQTEHGARIPVAEWTRSGSFICRDAFLDLDVKKRKIWGLGLSAPTGWIALGHDLRPLSDIALTNPSHLGQEIHDWIEDDVRRRAQIEMILSPKDYFRFVVSGALASDVTSACRTGLTGQDGEWCEESLREHGLDRTWFPPVFESTSKTGQLTNDGMEALSLQGRLWLVGGCELSVASQIASTDPRGKLWASAKFGVLRWEAGSSRPQATAGFTLHRSAFSGEWCLEKPWSGDAAEVDAAVESLTQNGHHVSGTFDDEGEAAIGAAILAARGSEMVKSWDRLYRQLDPSPPA